MIEVEKLNGQTVKVNLDNVLYGKIGINKITLYFGSGAILDIVMAEKSKLIGFEGNDAVLYNAVNVETIQSDMVRFVSGESIAIKIEQGKETPIKTKSPAKRTKQAKKVTS
jgi:hypothetical protein